MFAILFQVSDCCRFVNYIRGFPVHTLLNGFLSESYNNLGKLFSLRSTTACLEGQCGWTGFWAGLVGSPCPVSRTVPTSYIRVSWRSLGLTLAMNVATIIM